MTFVYILLVGNLLLTAWVMRAVNETDRVNIKMFAALNETLSDKLRVLESDIERLDQKIPKPY